MVEYLNADEGELRINDLYRLGVPFLFFTNYDCSRVFVAPIDSINTDKIRFSTPLLSMPYAEPTGQRPKKWFVKPPTFDEYKRAFTHVAENIRMGNSFLTNLTGRSALHTDMDMLQMYMAFSAPYKLYVEDCFALFSPEPFVHIHGDVITTYPMKGTIMADDYYAETRLLTDPKEMAEHATIVDLLRNDLSIVADNVRVSKYRYVERIPGAKGELLQTSSAIKGRLKPCYVDNVGSAVFRMLPAGSITGAPKKSTMQIISDAEGESRGFYTGVFGVSDGKSLQSAVMIRFVECRNGELFFRSGGGITSASNVHDEYEELILKTNAPIY